MSQETNENRGQWSSHIGFILAAAGSAIGLGSIWRFPYMTGENGGAAFVLLYLVCAVLIGIPMMWNEISVGRCTQKSLIGAMTKLKPRTPWVITAFLGFVISFVVLGYYSVISGWTIGYIYVTVTKTEMNFGDFIANLWYSIPLFAVFIFLTVWIVQSGVQKGIERWCNILMPTLFLICIAIAIYSVTLPNSIVGIKYYLIPDFNKINTSVVLKVIGQAFFSLSVGCGLMTVYGSYMSKQQSIVKSSLVVCFATASVALLAGFMIFPAVFAFGKSPAGGTTLTFQVLPEVFRSMPGGIFVGGAFFFLLFVAALTSSISLLEVPVAYFVDERGWTRKKASWILGFFAFILGIPSALSFGSEKSHGILQWFTNIEFLGQKGFLSIIDYIFGTLGFVTGGLLLCLFVGWRCKTSLLADEMAEGTSWFKSPILGISIADIWVFIIRFVCPSVLIVLLLSEAKIIAYPLITGISVFVVLVILQIVKICVQSKSSEK